MTEIEGKKARMIIRREVIQYYHGICHTNCGVKGDTL